MRKELRFDAEGEGDDSDPGANALRGGVAVALGLGLAGCGGGFDLQVGAFEVGQRDAILWTHVVPDDPDAGVVALTVKVATDPEFNHIVSSRPAFASAKNDFTVRSRV